jgi:c-di-AMP phosphodiesterase-like protein
MDVLLSNKGNFYYLVLCTVIIAISLIISVIFFRSKQKNVAVIAFLVFLFTTFLFSWSVYMLTEDQQQSSVRMLGKAISDTLSNDRSTAEGATRFYQYKVMEQEENLELDWKKDQSFQFVLTLNNTESGCNNMITGNANMEVGNQEIEMDVDEKGSSYPTKQYVYETDSCRLSFRIAVKDCSRVNIICAGCGDSNDCPILSTGTLKLVSSIQGTKEKLLPFKDH